MNDEMIIGTREEQRPDVMELENESDCSKVPEAIVKELQANLFPPAPKKLNFFSNFLFKTITNQDQNENDEKLKNSYTNRDLYTINKEYTFTPQLPRWPTECQVLDERIGHIYYNPTDPEPYYTPTGEEAQPAPAGDECGTVVYQYNPISAVNYFTRSSIGGGCYIQSPTIQYDIEDEETLEFESRFECGNLEKAIRITSSYYELYLRSDFYTNRHMQWFYFRITNMKKKFLYRFSIVNFTKDGSLFAEGMRPLMYSKKDAQLHSIGWRRFGDNITYYSNDNVCPDDPDAQMTYTLTFTTEFPHDNDEVYFANCYPYTYSDLEEYLEKLANHPIKSRFTTIRLLCKSLAGNNVHHVTITTPQQTDQCKRKPAVVITARVHPGETPSSWIMKGFIDYLTSDCLIAKELRDRFIFKLIPMLNPDGVIVGNNRCSLTGKDLNRQYKSVIREQYPSVCYTKMLIRRLLDECGVALYCDLHAHSRQHNIFIYGCEKHNKNGINNEIKLQEQVFPLLLHKNADDKFCFESCKFKVQKSKEGTGRVVMWMLGIPNSYTMEASFAGSTLGSRNLTHFNLYDFEQMAKAFCQTLLDLYDDTPRKEKLRSKILHKLIQYGSNAYEPTNIELSDNSSDEDGISSSSSNEVGHDYDDYLITAPPPTPIINQKSTKKLKIKKKKPMKSPDVIRKPLPICKATLGLNFLSITNPYIIDSSDTDNNVDDLDQNYKKHKLKRRKSKKLIKSKKRQQSNDFQNTRKNIAVCELLPTEQINNETVFKRSRTPQQLKLDRKNMVTQQLSQVQAKLLSLKNKFWFGVRNDSSSETNIPLSTNLKKSMNKKNKSKKYKKLAKSSKSNKEITKTGLKRQTAIDVEENLKIKTSISLPTIKQLNIKNKQLNNCGSLVKSFLNCSINNDSNENEPTNCLLKKRKKQQQKDQKF